MRLSASVNTAAVTLHDLHVMFCVVSIKAIVYELYISRNIFNSNPYFPAILDSSHSLDPNKTPSNSTSHLSKLSNTGTIFSTTLNDFGAP